MLFTPEERQRYARHLDLPGFGAPAQERLRAGRVLHGLSAPGAPLFDRFQMEITTACSMACAFCGHALSERGARPMDFDLFREAVACVAREELAPAILFSGLGEPLLSPRLEEAVAWCKAQGLSARIITNGLGLTAARHESLLAAGVDRLMVSLHNLTPEAYVLRGARDGTDYPAFRARALACVDRHLARREPSELILFLMSADPGRLSSRVWDFPALDREAATLPRLVREFWDELRAIGRRHGQELRVGLDQALAAFAGLDNHGDRGHLQVFERVAVSIFPLFLQPEAVMRALRPRAMGGWDFEGRERGGCLYMEGPQVLATGEVIPCCAAPTFESELSALSLGRFEPGNPEASLSALLAGPRYRALHRGFWEGRAAWGFCRRCLALQDLSQREVEQAHEI